MMEALKLLLIECESVGDDVLDPPEADRVEAGEVVLGVLRSRDAKVAYTVWQRLSFASLRNFVDARAARTEVDRRQFESQSKAVGARLGFVKELFWYVAREELGSWDGDIGIRHGWQVVKLKRAHPLADLLRQLGAGEEIE